MSRLGKLPVTVPGGVNVAIKDRTITISKGEKSLEMTHRPEVKVTWDEDEKSVAVSIDEKDADNRQVRAYWGMTRALIQNMVVGVTEGYQKQLEVMGVGYTAALNGNKLDLKVGFANTITKEVPPGLDVSVEKQWITIKGADKQLVGQFAAAVRGVRKPEPYNSKGIRYSDETVVRKQGKAFGA
jgi:large subunit ribosomal protein L6